MAYFYIIFFILYPLFIIPLIHAQSFSSFVGPAISAQSTGLQKIPGQAFSDTVSNTFSGFSGNLNKLSGPLTSGNTVPDVDVGPPNVIAPGFPQPGVGGVGGPGVGGFQPGGGIQPNFAQGGGMLGAPGGGMGGMGGIGGISTQFTSSSGGPSISVPGDNSGGGDAGGGSGGYGGGSGSYGSAGGGDYGANAGYGGYPGRGGFSGYWEPGVRPVPLALQGWGLFIPRPPVEITTPTTVATTTGKPVPTVGPSIYMNSNYAGSYYSLVTTPAPAPPTTVTTTTTTTTKAPTTTPTTTTTTTTKAPATYGSSYNSGSGGYGISYYTVTIPPPPTTRPPTTAAPYYGGSSYGSYPSSSYSGYGATGGTANKNLPMSLTEQKVLIMGSNTPLESNRFKTQSGDVSVDVAVEPPSSCVPTKTPSAKGICVDDGLLQIVCPNMIVAESDDCNKGTQGSWCCFVDSSP